MIIKKSKKVKKEYKKPGRKRLYEEGSGSFTFSTSPSIAKEMKDYYGSLTAAFKTIYLPSRDDKK